jgi:hypothetical protein
MTINIELIMGLYQGRDGKKYCVANLQEINGVKLFELVESDKHDDLDAIATDLLESDWNEIVESLGLTFIKLNKNDLPSSEGDYFMTHKIGIKKQVKIENLAISDKHPKNLHVFESPQDYYALSVENGCDEYSWELRSNLI